jgi:hypothetical protein
MGFFWDLRPGQVFPIAERKLTIKVVRFDPARATATVTVTNDK